MAISHAAHTKTFAAFWPTILFAAIIGATSLHHVMWQDEWYVWLFCREHHSLASLFHDIRYDGHPALWYLVLYAVTRVTQAAVAMQLLHALIASASVFLIWRFSPLKWWEKTLICAGYFFIFEYAVIARPYALEVFLSLLAVTLADRVSQSPLPLAVVLLLLGQTTAFGMVMSAAIAAAMMVRFWHGPRPSRSQSAAAAAILAVSICLFLLQTRPPADARGFAQWSNFDGPLHPATATASLWNAFVPLPVVQLHWWNSHLLRLPEGVEAGFGLGMVALTALFVLRTIEARALFLVGSAGILATVLLVYTGEMRHWGHYVIVLILAAWVDRARGPGPRSSGRGIWMALLGVQAIAGSMAVALDWRIPFSASRSAARRIHQIDPHLPLAGDFDYALLSLAGYLDTPIYFPRSQHLAFTYRLDSHRRRNLTPQILAHELQGLADREHSDVLVVMTYEMPMPPQCRLMETIAAENVANEVYFIYRYAGPSGE